MCAVILLCSKLYKLFLTYMYSQSLTLIKTNLHILKLPIVLGIQKIGVIENRRVKKIIGETTDIIIPNFQPS